MSAIGFALRHQDAGVVSEHVFTSTPVAEQLEELLKLMAHRHGPTELVQAPGQQSPGARWAMLVEVRLYGPGENVPPPPIVQKNTLETHAPRVRAFGTVG